MANLRLRSDLDDWTKLPVQYDESTMELMQLGEIKEYLERYPPEYHGPTWQQDEETGNWILPEHTLGWQQAAWAAQWLLGFDGGAWRYTPEQLRFLLHFQAVDRRGQWLWRKALFQRNKGWGKDPMGMAFGITKWIGPSRFYQWDSQRDQPIGMADRSAWVQIAAVSQDQTQNASNLIPMMLPKSTRERYDLKVGIEKSRQRSTGAQLQMAASNPEALQGGRVTLGIADEVHHWYPINRGEAMWETMEQNAAKVQGQVLCITNAHRPGEDSIGERIRTEYDNICAGRQDNDSQLLYDSIEAHPETPPTKEAIRAIFPIIRGDSTWLKVESVIPSFMSTAIQLSKSRRMWLNQVVASDDALLPDEAIEAVLFDEYELYDGDTIVLGFDGSRGDDATALVAIKPSDYSAYLLGLWERPSDHSKKEWQVDEAEVDRFVRDVMTRYNVVGAFADRALWESWIHGWERDFGDQMQTRANGPNQPIGWDMRGRVKKSTEAHELLLSAIEREHIRIHRDARMVKHMKNAVRHENTYGVSFRKASPDSPHKVDAYAALMLAYLCAAQWRTSQMEEDSTFLIQN